MKSRIPHTIRGALVVLLLLGLNVQQGWSLSWWGKRDNREGLVAMVRNRAILFPKEGAAKPVELNDAFQVGDRLRTRDDSAARVLFMEDSFLNIGPQTTYELTKSRYDEVTGSRDVGFGLVAGKVRLAVGRLFGRGTATVETPTAVVGVKGTDILVGYDDQAKVMQLIVLSGIAEITSKNPQVSTVVVQVPAGQFTEVGQEAAPPQTQPAPQSLVNEFLAATEVMPDPSRKIPEVTLTEAQQTVAPLTTVSGTTETQTVNTVLASSQSNVAGGSSEPSTLQTTGGILNVEVLPPPVLTVPPDLCPGNCP